LSDKDEAANNVIPVAQAINSTNSGQDIKVMMASRSGIPLVIRKGRPLAKLHFEPAFTTNKLPEQARTDIPYICGLRAEAKKPKFISASHRLYRSKFSWDMYASKEVVVPPRKSKIVQLGVTMNIPKGMTMVWYPHQETPQIMPERNPYDVKAYWDSLTQTESIQVQNLTDEAFTIQKHQVVCRLEIRHHPYTPKNPRILPGHTIKKIEPGARVIRTNIEDPWTVLSQTAPKPIEIGSGKEVEIPTGIEFYTPPGYKLVWEKHSTMLDEFEITNPEPIDHGAVIRLKSSYHSPCCAKTLVLAKALLVPKTDGKDQKQITLKSVEPDAKRPEQQPDGSWLVYSRRKERIPSHTGDFIPTGAIFDIPEGEQPEWNIYDDGESMWWGWVLGSRYIKHPDLERFFPTWKEEAHVHICNILNILTGIAKHTPMAILSLKQNKTKPPKEEDLEKLGVPYIKSVVKGARPPMWQHNGRCLVFAHGNNYTIPQAKTEVPYGAIFEIPEGTTAKWFPYPATSYADPDDSLIPADSEFQNNGKLSMTTTEEIVELIQNQQPLAVLEFTPDPFVEHPEMLRNPLVEIED
jgi:dUTPase